MIGDPGAARRAPVRVVRDVVAVLLLLAGLAGLVIIGFGIDPALGWAGVCSATVAVGVVLGRA